MCIELQITVMAFRTLWNPDLAWQIANRINIACSTDIMQQTFTAHKAMVPKVSCSIPEADELGGKLTLVGIV